MRAGPIRRGLTPGIIVLVACACAAAVVMARAADDAAPVLSADIPQDVTPVENPTQDDLDHHSWRMFVAMNWPVGANRTPIAGSIGDHSDALRRWETYTDATLIIPPRKGFSVRVPETSDGRRALNTDFVVQAGTGRPLVDATQNFIVNEFVINPTLVDFTIKNGLVSNEGFTTYAKSHSELVFPTGTITVKAAWRIFPANTPDAVRRRYHVRDATISVPAHKTKSGKALTITDAKVGLVGFHIVQKTPSHPHWIWSTFEHVDLAEGPEPVLKTGTVGAAQSNRTPLIVETGKRMKHDVWLDPANGHATAALFDPPVVARAPNELSFPAPINSAWQAALPAQWSNYRLVTTQWIDAAGKIHPTNTDGVSISRNISMETYLIGNQAIAAQVPGNHVNDACPQSGDGSTLWAMVEQLDRFVDTPDTVHTADTLSNCYSCHQFGLYKYGDADTDAILTDRSFVFKTFLPVNRCADRG
jgi:hypothetical protein